MLKSMGVFAVCLTVSGCAVSPAQQEAMRAFAASGAPAQSYNYYDIYRAQKALQRAPVTCYTINNPNGAIVTCY